MQEDDDSRPQDFVSRTKGFWTAKEKKRENIYIDKHLQAKLFDLPLIYLQLNFFWLQFKKFSFQIFLFFDCSFKRFALKSILFDCIKKALMARRSWASLVRNTEFKSWKVKCEAWHLPMTSEIWNAALRSFSFSPSDCVSGVFKCQPINRQWVYCNKNPIVNEKSPVNGDLLGISVRAAPFHCDMAETIQGMQS